MRRLSFLVFVLGLGFALAAESARSSPCQRGLDQITLRLLSEGKPADPTDYVVRWLKQIDSKNGFEDLTWALVAQITDLAQLARVEFKSHISTQMKSALRLAIGQIISDHRLRDAADLKKVSEGVRALLGRRDGRLDARETNREETRFIFGNTIIDSFHSLDGIFVRSIMRTSQGEEFLVGQNPTEHGIMNLKTGQWFKIKPGHLTPLYSYLETSRGDALAVVNNSRDPQVFDLRTGVVRFEPTERDLLRANPKTALSLHGPLMGTSFTKLRVN